MKLSEILHKLLLNYMEQNKRIGHLKTESSFFKDHPNTHTHIYTHIHGYKYAQIYCESTHKPKTRTNIFCLIK